MLTNAKCMINLGKRALKTVACLLLAVAEACQGASLLAEACLVASTTAVDQQMTFLQRCVVLVTDAIMIRPHVHDP